MQRATSIVRKAAVKADKVIDQVSLDHEGRHRRRITLTGEKGRQYVQRKYPEAEIAHV